MPAAIPRALKRLSVQFRGMGAPETEIVVTGTVKSVEATRSSIDTVAAQGDNQTIRNAEAEVRAVGRRERRVALPKRAAGAALECLGRATRRSS